MGFILGAIFGTIKAPCHSAFYLLDWQIWLWYL